MTDLRKAAADVLARWDDEKQADFTDMMEALRAALDAPDEPGCCIPNCKSRPALRVCSLHDPLKDASGGGEHPWSMVVADGDISGWILREALECLTYWRVDQPRQIPLVQRTMQLEATIRQVQAQRISLAKGAGVVQGRTKATQRLTHEIIRARGRCGGCQSSSPPRLCDGCRDLKNAWLALRAERGIDIRPRDKCTCGLPRSVHAGGQPDIGACTGFVPAASSAPAHPEPGEAPSIHYGSNGMAECGAEDHRVPVERLTKRPEDVTCATCRGYLPIVAPHSEAPRGQEPVACDSCHGTGKYTIEPYACPTCHGTGKAGGEGAR